MAVLIFNALVMTTGWIVGALLKRPVEDKIALSVISSTEIAAPARLFSVTMYIFGVGLVIWRHLASSGVGAH
ncbi:hypothetical protein [Corynebacterium sp.]|uniref:hypothetical protein n=1 Tax=Corynebacterium sp. TaxID=1720 RepID=UPI0025BA9641|nr:hypothetical protein [Corynebacterium sp.]